MLLKTSHFSKGLCFQYIIVISALLLSSSCLIGQKGNRLNFTSIQITEGLPNNNVNAVTQDDLGFLWVGTNDGLMRYDTPQSQYVYKSGQIGLESNIIKSLHRGEDNRIWIGTNFGGLTRYNVETGSYKTYNNSSEDKWKLSNNQVISIESNGPELFLGTEKGLNVLYPESDSIYQFPNVGDIDMGDYSILNIHVDNQEWIWVGTWNNNFYLYLPHPSGRYDLGKFRRFEINQLEGSQHVWKVFQDRDGRYWVGTHNGGLYLMTLPPEATNQIGEQDWNPKFTKIPHDIKEPNNISSNIIQDIIQDAKGNLWVSTQHGLNFLDSEQLDKLDYTDPNLNPKFYRQYYSTEYGNTLSTNQVTKMFEDQQGHIWIASSNGVNQFNEELNQFEWYNLNYENVDFEQKFDLINAMVEINDSLLILGSSLLGLVSFDKKNSRFIPIDSKFKAFENKKINCLNYNDDILYVGTDKDITEVNLKTNQSHTYDIGHPYSGEIPNIQFTSILGDSQGNLWVGSYSGLIKIDRKSKKTQWFNTDSASDSNITDNSITQIYEDSEGTIWVTTYNGINVIKNQNGEMTIEKLKRIENEKNTIPSNRVRSIYEHNKKLYFGCDNGLFTIDLETRSINRFRDSMINYQVNNIKISKNDELWAGTSDGLLRYNLNTNKSYLYTRNEGIGHLAFQNSGSLISENDFLIGGSKSFAILNNNNQQKTATLPNTYITEIKVINADTDTTYRNNSLVDLEVPSDNYFVSFKYANLDYNMLNKSTYRYRLLGFSNEDWQTTYDDQVSYTNLMPGDYTFEVMTQTKGEFTSDKVSSIDLEVLPSFVETIWFKLLLLGLLGLLFYFGNLIQSRTIRRRNEILEDYNTQLNKEIEKTARANASLEERERSMQVLVKKLNKSNEGLIRSNKDLEEFAYVASHDLQEPLNTVKSYTDLLNRKMKDSKDPLTTKSMEYILGGVTRMSALIKSILTYSIVSSEDIYLETIDVHELIQSKIKDLDLIIKQKNVKINIEDLPTITCDGGQIGMVFYNLILNGIKFNNSPSPTIEISSTETETSWEFHVKDNGIGIPEQYKEKIFKIFQRLHSKADYEGTGIGLSLCNKIVHRHDGNITIDSIEGAGTTFTFSISKSLSTDVKEATQSSLIQTPQKASSSQEG